jgi:hypothetical protein
MRRANSDLLLDEQEVNAHLCPVQGPECPGRLPFLDDDRAIRFDEPVRPSDQAQPHRGERDPVERHRLAAAQAAAEPHAPARPTARPDRGDAWEPTADRDPTDEDAPTDGRQLLGWASKQIPDLKGILIGYGKKKGLRSKIVEWTPQQVNAAYRFARARQAQHR